ncbi:MAG TPA: GTPase HflX [Clostridiales bacterium UBA8153]|nr:GTPase HflX [Clostridiales bacterium UBA8153]
MVTGANCREVVTVPGNRVHDVTPITSSLALLVAITGGESPWAVEKSLDELERLADTAGMRECGRIIQDRTGPDAATYVGKGKLQTIEAERERHGADTVLFDGELSASQVRNIQEVVNGRVLDRTQLILEIFSARAQSREGKAQVELAQLTYLLPRLTGHGVELSRLGGGIGTRGPGETKLEVDRRQIRRRIESLRAELELIRRQRRLRREGRHSGGTPVLALVGYTNAGKSTLLNALTGADALTEDKLFATLDPMTRQLVLPHGQQVVVTDTVGFLRKLPHELVAAFRATLEEVGEADLLLHVVDASSPELEGQVATVVEVLTQLEAADRPILTVLNKCDLIGEAAAEALAARWEPAVTVAARSGQGLAQLLAAVERELANTREQLTLRIPYGRAAVLDLVHEYGKVLAQRYEETGVVVEAELPRAWAGRVRRQLEV